MGASGTLMKGEEIKQALVGISRHKLYSTLVASHHPGLSPSLGFQEEWLVAFLILQLPFSDHFFPSDSHSCARYHFYPKYIFYSIMLRVVLLSD